MEYTKCDKCYVYLTKGSRYKTHNFQCIAKTDLDVHILLEGDDTNRTIFRIIDAKRLIFVYTK